MNRMETDTMEAKTNSKNHQKTRPAERRPEPSAKNWPLDYNPLALISPLQEKQLSLEEKAFIFFLIYYRTNKGIGLKDFIDNLERIIITATMEMLHNHQRAVARFLGLKPTTLNEKIKKYDIKFRPESADDWIWNILGI